MYNVRANSLITFYFEKQTSVFLSARLTSHKTSTFELADVVLFIATLVDLFTLMFVFCFGFSLSLTCCTAVLRTPEYEVYKAVS